MDVLITHILHILKEEVHAGVVHLNVDFQVVWTIRVVDYDTKRVRFNVVKEYQTQQVQELQLQLEPKQAPWSLGPYLYGLVLDRHEGQYVILQKVMSWLYTPKRHRCRSDGINFQ